MVEQNQKKETTTTEESQSLPSTPIWDDNPALPADFEKQREMEGDNIDIEQEEREESKRLEEFLRSVVEQESIEIRKSQIEE